MDTNVKVATNWNLIGGTDICRVIQTNVTHDDIFIKPVLEEILSEDRAVLLSATTGDVACAVPQGPCEFNIRIFPKYKIGSLTLVCTVPKIEIFAGSQNEYMETVYGNIIDDEDDDDSIPSYRFDVQIAKSSVTEIMIKLLSSSAEICIYAIELNVAANNNNISNSMSNAINLKQVQEILDNSKQKLSPNAEKCKTFLQAYNSTSITQNRELNTSNNLLEQFQKMMGLNIKDVLYNKETTENEQNNSTKVLRGEEQLKSYIDSKFTDLENKILSRLDAIEQKQNLKLDRILNFLEIKCKDIK